MKYTFQVVARHGAKLVFLSLMNQSAMLQPGERRGFRQANYCEFLAVPQSQQYTFIPECKYVVNTSGFDEADYFDLISPWKRLTVIKPGLAVPYKNVVRIDAKVTMQHLTTVRPARRASRRVLPIYRSKMRLRLFTTGQGGSQIPSSLFISGQPVQQCRLLRKRFTDVCG